MTVGQVGSPPSGGGSASADSLLPPATVLRLADCVEAVGATPAAVRASAAAVEGRALSDRVRTVRDAVLADLPAEPRAFAGVVRAGLAVPGFTGWMLWPVGEAVAVRALEPGPDRAGRFDEGLALLAALTPRLSSEFALRPFLVADLDRALPVVQTWTADPDEHVRRLASEGTRPRLPWARRVPGISAAPHRTAPILDALYRDPSATVRRSAANHLNDVSRAEAALATTTAARWLEAPDEHTPQVVRHALRTLVKRGDREALGLLGFPPDAEVTVDGPVLDDDRVAVGGVLSFSVGVRAARPARLAVDYVVHYRKANGSLAPKVFKLAVRALGAGERATFTGRRSFAPVTTRTLHPGAHALEVQVNGVRYGRTPFTVVPGPGAG